MRINYCLSKVKLKENGKPIYKRFGGKARETLRGSIEIDIDWENNEDHTKLRQAIYEKHPGWNLAGYAKVEE
jgi:hypothetical protein